MGVIVLELDFLKEVSKILSLILIIRRGWFFEISLD